MATNYIVANQAGFQTAKTDVTYIGKDATISGRIDLMGNHGGDERLFIYGTVLGDLSDYDLQSTAHYNILIGPTGSVNWVSWGAIQLGGGGHWITNLGTVTSMGGNTIYIIPDYAASGALDRNYIVNGGTISTTSYDPARGYGDATINVQANQAASVTLTNTGNIFSAAGFAMSLAGGDDVVRNTGFIGGGSQLWSGNDLFDSRGGTLAGEVRGWLGDDTIFGGVTADTLIGEDGDDELDGSVGNDIMIGGAGDDVYTVDSTEDIVDENNVTYGGDGADVIHSSVSLDLSDTTHVIGVVEKLALQGAANLDGTGSTRSETIAGNLGANVLRGEAGNDRLYGAAADDRLLGGAGADRLFGQSGEDVLVGADGDDLLDGGTGGDTMYGGGGDDTYVVDFVDDVVSEALAGSGGTDLVQSTIDFKLSDAAHVKGSVENLTLLGSASLFGIGNALANTIVGNVGVNTIDGGTGNDVLTGGGGADKFRFSSALSGNLDTIKDFIHNTDKIVLDHAIFAQLSAGNLSAGNFAINAPGDANDYIVYNTTTGGLSYDSNGNGAGGATAFAKLSGVPGITQGDLLIV